MAFAPIAPWIVPPDYIGAASRGAQLGLSARSQDEQEQAAADRLSLAYKTLASQEQRALEATQARREQATAALALRGKQMDALGQYRKNRLDQQEEGLNLREKAMANAANRPIHIGPNLYDAKGNLIVDTKEGQLTDEEKMSLRAAQSSKIQAERLLTNPNMTPQARAGLSNDLAKAEMVIQSISGRAPPQIAAPATNAPPASAALQAKPGVMSRVWSALFPGDATSAAPAAVAPSSGMPTFRSDEEKQSWLNAKQAIASGKNRQKVLDKMQKAGFILEGL